MHHFGIEQRTVNSHKSVYHSLQLSPRRKFIAFLFSIAAHGGDSRIRANRVAENPLSKHFRVPLMGVKFDISLSDSLSIHICGTHPRSEITRERKQCRFHRI